MTNLQALKIALDALNLIEPEIELKSDWTIKDVKNKISKLISQYEKRKSAKREE